MDIGKYIYENSTKKSVLTYDNNKRVTVNLIKFPNTELERLEFINEFIIHYKTFLEHLHYPDFSETFLLQPTAVYSEKE